MNSRLRRTLSIAILGLGGLAGWFSAGGPTILPAGPVPGPAAPAFVMNGTQLLALTFVNTSDEPQSMQQWKGRIVVVNFWATWCPPCRREIPDFASVAVQYRDRGVQFVGLGIDSAENIRRFDDDAKVPYPLLVAGTGSLPIMEALGNPSLGLPFTLILDGSGEIRVKRLGPMSRESLVENLDRLLSG